MSDIKCGTHRSRDPAAALTRLGAIAGCYHWQPCKGPQPEARCDEAAARLRPMAGSPTEYEYLRPGNGTQSSSQSAPPTFTQ